MQFDRFPRKKAIMTTLDFGDRDMERPPEEQLDQLQRAYRPAELKRAVFYSKTQAALDKKQQMVDMLKKEKAELQMTYNKAREGRFLREDEMSVKLFEGLLKCQSTSKAIKDEECHKIKEIDEKLRQTDKQMHQLRMQLIEMRKNKCPVTSNEKVIQILENKLYQESVAQNKVVHKNTVLREYLQHLLILRARFNTLYGRYNKTLSKGKRKIQNLCKEAGAAQDQRDEIRSHLISLNKYTTLQYNKLIAEVQEMSRIAKLKGQYVPFMLKKEKARVGYPEGFGSKQEKIDTKPEEQLKFYQDTFEKIKIATQESDTNEIVKHFLESEDENFKLFNYANELRDESEHIQEKINNFQEKLREANMEEELQDEKSIVVKESLEQKLKATEANRYTLQKKLASCQKTFNEIKEGIGEIYKKSRCSDQYLRKMLCGEAGATKDNILDYLSVLESWISDLVPFFEYLGKRAKAVSEAESDLEKQKGTPKYDVRAYSKLSAMSGSIPSLQASIASTEPYPDVEDIKTVTFPEFELPELTRDPSAGVDESESLKLPYTKSQLKIIATDRLASSDFSEKRSLRKRLY